MLRKLGLSSSHQKSSVAVEEARTMTEDLEIVSTRLIFNDHVTLKAVKVVLNASSNDHQETKSQRDFIPLNSTFAIQTYFKGAFIYLLSRWLCFMYILQKYFEYQSTQS